MKKLLITITISTLLCFALAPVTAAAGPFTATIHTTSTAPGGAVRAGHHKLIQWFDETICSPGNTFELYNLKDDIVEQDNLTKKMPQKGKKIKKVMMTCPN